MGFAPEGCKSLDPVFSCQVGQKISVFVHAKRAPLPCSYTTANIFRLEMLKYIFTHTSSRIPYYDRFSFS